MTALGNVIALIRQLDDEGCDASAFGIATTRLQSWELPPASVDGSSLGEVMAFIRGVLGSSGCGTDEGEGDDDACSERVAEIVSLARCVAHARARAAAEMRI